MILCFVLLSYEMTPDKLNVFRLSESFEYLIQILPHRGGVVVVSRDLKGNLVFGFGVDRRSNELTDFGGGIAYSREKETPTGGALREFSEESAGIFQNKIDYTNISDIPVVVNNNMFIMFVPIKYSSLDDISREYQKLTYTDPKREISKIVWLTEFDLRQSLIFSQIYHTPASTRYGKFYSIVSKLLKSSFADVLMSIKEII